MRKFILLYFSQILSDQSFAFVKLTSIQMKEHIINIGVNSWIAIIVFNQTATMWISLLYHVHVPMQVFTNASVHWMLYTVQGSTTWTKFTQHGTQKTMGQQLQTTMVAQLIGLGGLKTNQWSVSPLKANEASLWYLSWPGLTWPVTDPQKS